MKDQKPPMGSNGRVLLILYKSVYEVGVGGKRKKRERRKRGEECSPRSISLSFKSVTCSGKKEKGEGEALMDHVLPARSVIKLRGKKREEKKPVRPECAPRNLLYIPAIEPGKGLPDEVEGKKKKGKGGGGGGRASSSRPSFF